MENTNFNEIMLNKDLPVFFNKDKIYYLQSMGIETLYQLINAYNDGFFNDKRKKFNSELKGEVEILLSYYCKTPLINDGFLETTIDIKNVDEIFNDKKIKRSMQRIGITENEFRILHIYFEKGFANSIMNYNESNNIKVLDLLKMFCDDTHFQASILSSSGAMYNLYSTDIQNLIFKAKFFESYLKDKEQSLYNRNDTDTIRKLEFELNFLRQAKGNLEKQIVLLENQLSNVYSAGGLKK